MSADADVEAKSVKRKLESGHFQPRKILKSKPLSQLRGNGVSLSDDRSAKPSFRNISTSLLKLSRDTVPHSRNAILHTLTEDRSRGERKMLLLAITQEISPRTSARERVTSGGQTAIMTSCQDEMIHPGIWAEKTGMLRVGIEMFYKYPKTRPNNIGVGMQCFIRKIFSDRHPFVYNVEEPDPGVAATVQNVTANVLHPLSYLEQLNSVAFTSGASVYARYPGSPTFYRAQILSFRGTGYLVEFGAVGGGYGQENLFVETKYVLDPKMV